MLIKEKLEWLYNLQGKGIKLGLDRVKKLAQVFENPQNDFLSIHIAGTNGKGSVAKIIYTILKEQGYNVGLYTSPHLVRFNERIVVGGKKINDEDIVRLIDFINKKIMDKGIDASFFEFTTLMAYIYFMEKKIDIAVIETGMGGRLDATNIVKPVVSVITNIGFDHEKHLGDSVEKIAFEKCGIVKKGIPVITGCVEKALDVIKKVCLEKKSKLLVVEDEAKIKLIKEKSEEIRSEGTKLKFQQAEIVTNKDKYNVKTRLLGEHQLQNIATAIVACEVINQRLEINKDSIEKGIVNTYWPGRIEVVGQNPLIIVDGTHNVQGMMSLRKFLEENIVNKFDKLILVIGISEDKNKENMIKLIAGIFDQIIVCQAEYKGSDVDELKKIAEKHNTNTIICIKDVKSAVRKAIDIADENDGIIITGSIYVVGEAKQALK